VNIGNNESTKFFIPKIISNVKEAQSTPMPFETPAMRTNKKTMNTNRTNDPRVKYGEPPVFPVLNTSANTTTPIAATDSTPNSQNGNVLIPDVTGQDNNITWTPGMATPPQEQPQEQPQLEQSAIQQNKNDPGSPTQPQSATANATTATGGYSRKGKIKRNPKMNKKITRKHRK